MTEVHHLLITSENLDDAAATDETQTSDGVTLGPRDARTCWLAWFAETNRRTARWIVR